MTDHRPDWTCFDFAAGIYDATRGFPPGVSEKVAASLLTALPENAHLLEVGVGTGRIARPLLDLGADLVGVDVSPLMLDRLVKNLALGANTPKIMIAEAAALPFNARLFDAVLFIHVLHLIPSWQAVLTESRRCLNSGGVLILGYDWRSEDNPIGIVRRRFKAIIAELLPEDKDPEPGSFTFMEEYLLVQGAQKESWEAAEWMRRYHISQDIDNYASGYYSSAQRLPADVRMEAIARLRLWCTQQLGSLDQEFLIPQKFIWERYRWDA